MAIHRKTPEQKIKAYIDEFIKRKEALIIRNMSYLGEMCVNVARDSNAYKDRTANLRASTGWILLKNGKIISNGGFSPVSGKGAGGTNSGESYAKSLIKEHLTGFVLIVVAGMNYAAHVESTGRDVLTSAELFAQTRMPKILKSIGLK
jgi:hypothetical protein